MGIVERLPHVLVPLELWYGIAHARSCLLRVQLTTIIWPVVTDSGDTWGASDKRKLN
jgi:hypothetical protein